MKTKRIVIIDDDSDVRDGLERWLSSDYIVQSYESAEAFLSGVDALNLSGALPTCLLLDFYMPGMNGGELQDTLKAANFLCPIVFMSGSAQNADIISAWRGGAVNFILKPFNALEISSALLHAFSRISERTDGDLPITSREAQVLRLLGKGIQQQQVAQMLGLSLRTVKMYRTFLKNKLNLNSLIELARYCDTHQVAIEKLAEENPVSKK